MRKAFIVALLIVAAPPVVRLAWSVCQTISLTDVTKVSKTGDTMNGDLTLENDGTDLRVGGDVSVLTDLNVVGQSTFHSSVTFRSAISAGTIDGPITVNSSATFNATVGLNNINGPITVQSSSTFHAPVIVYSSVTANRFYGDGSQLTGVATSGGNTIGFVTDNFLSQANGSQTSFTLSFAPSNAAALQVIQDGLLLSPTSDYTYTTGTTLTMTAPPASNSSSFFVRYSTGVTAILSNGSNCSAGSYPLGVDAGGNSESCTVALDATSNNIFTGQNRFSNDTTFTDSVYISAASTIGPQGYATAVTKSSGTFNNMWMVVASYNPSSDSAISFTSLTENRRYRMNWILTKNTAGTLSVRFNSDSGSNYKYATDGINTNGGAASQAASNSATSCLLNGGGGSVGDTLQSEGSFEFAYKPSDSTVVVGHGRHVWEDANPFEHSNSVGCKYDGSSAVTSLSLLASAGTFTGYMYLEELIVPNP